MTKIILSAAEIDSSNRGVGALFYGTITLLQKTFDFDEIYTLQMGKPRVEKILEININGKQIKCINARFRKRYFLLAYFQLFFSKFGIPFKNPLINYLKDVDLYCAINGGDSFSDIYGFKRLYREFKQIFLTELAGVKVIFTPQTIGPFYSLRAKILATIALKLAHKVYTRDEKGDKFLSKIGVKSVRTRDVSAYMLPQKTNYIVKPNTIGININGLMWENIYPGLKGCFDNYKILLKELVDKILKDTNYNILFIPHTYSLTQEFIENDYKAIKEFLQNYDNNPRITYLDKEYTSPELKYIISQTEFFIGSRMHSNLAALTTSTPTVALSYSYKFTGTFKIFNIEECVINAKDIAQEDISEIVKKVLEQINRKTEIKQKLEKVNSEAEEFSLL